MLINDIKYACATCIKGHRSSTCNHSDRELIEIKKKGRPVSQCNHCRELRKTKQVHVRCMCEGRSEAVAASLSRSVIIPIADPIEDSSHNHPVSSCACAATGADGCNCCTPRHNQRKAAPSHASKKTCDSKPPFARGHTFSANVEEPRHAAALQRSTSLHGHHGQKTIHHHALHFTPYPAPPRGPEDAEGSVALESDKAKEATAVPVVARRSRSHSTAALRLQQPTLMGDLPSLYGNVSASVSSPHLGLESQTSAEISSNALAFPAETKEPFSVYIPGFESFASALSRLPSLPQVPMLDMQETATFQTPFHPSQFPANDGSDLIAQSSPSWPHPEGASRDTEGSFFTLMSRLNHPSSSQAGLATSHTSSRPPSMTSRASSVSGGALSQDPCEVGHFGETQLSETSYAPRGRVPRGDNADFSLTVADLVYATSHQRHQLDIEQYPPSNGEVDVQQLDFTFLDGVSRLPGAAAFWREFWIKDVSSSEYPEGFMESELDETNRCAMDGNAPLVSMVQGSSSQKSPQVLHDQDDSSTEFPWMA